MNPTTAPTPMVPHDLYKDVHKAIRVQLCELVADAGRLDPSDRSGRVSLGARIFDLVDFLVLHAHHEDVEIEDQVRRILPECADAIAAEHVALEATMEELKVRAHTVMDESCTDHRAALHELYLELAAFTGRYFAHQDVEERVVMPALFAGLGFEGVVEIHGRILESIPPQEMVWSLSMMVPAMNSDDRVEMYTGMRAGAPPEAFAGLLGLAADVLAPAELAKLEAGLDATLVPAGV